MTSPYALCGPVKRARVMESHVFCPFVVREPEPNQPYQTGEIGKKEGGKRKKIIRISSDDETKRGPNAVKRK